MRAHRASTTAIKVGRLLLYVGADPQLGPLLPPDCAETTEALLRAAGLLADWHLRVFQGRRGHQALGWSERVLVPGQFAHLALRKRFIDDETRAAIEAGIDTVLVVGAGFDTLGYRLAKQHREARFWELDHPATQSLKARALGELDRPANLYLHPVDLSQAALPDVLEEIGWDRRARSVVILEGLLMYLHEDEVADVLRNLFSGMAPGSRLLGTFLLPDAKGRPQLGRLGGLTRASLRLMGEPMQWTCTPDAMEELLGEAGFSPNTEPGRIDLGLRYLVPAGLDGLALARMERMFLAERGPDQGPRPRPQAVP